MFWPRAPRSVRSVSALDKEITRPHTRRLVQLYAALLYNANLKGFIDGHIYSGNLKAGGKQFAVCSKGFHLCYGYIPECIHVRRAGIAALIFLQAVERHIKNGHRFYTSKAFFI